LKLIDTHAHLDEIRDLEGALTRARDAGVRAIVAVGTDLSSNEKILQLAGRFPRFILPAVGLHPWKLDGADLEANFRFLEKELPRCLALGEVGLDFAIQTPREKTRRGPATDPDRCLPGKKARPFACPEGLGRELSVIEIFGDRKGGFPLV